MTFPGLPTPSPLTDPEMEALAQLHANDGPGCVVCRLMAQVQEAREARGALSTLLQATVVRCEEMQIRLSTLTAPEPRFTLLDRLVAWALWLYAKIGGGR